MKRLIFLLDIHVGLPGILEVSQEKRLEDIIKQAKKIVVNEEYILLLEGIPFGVSYQDYIKNFNKYLKDTLRGCYDALRFLFGENISFEVGWEKSDKVFKMLSSTFPNNVGWDDCYLLGYLSVILTFYEDKNVKVSEEEINRKVSRIMELRDKLLLKAIEKYSNYDNVLVFCGYLHAIVGEEIENRGVEVIYLGEDNICEEILPFFRALDKVSRLLEK